MPPCRSRLGRHPHVSAPGSGARRRPEAADLLSITIKGCRLHVRGIAKTQTRSGQQHAARSTQHATSKLPYAQFGGLRGLLPANLLAQTRVHQLISAAPRKRRRSAPPAALLPFLGCMQQLHVGAGQHAAKGSRRERPDHDHINYNPTRLSSFPFLVLGSWFALLSLSLTRLSRLSSGSLPTLFCYTGPVLYLDAATHAWSYWIRLDHRYCSIHTNPSSLVVRRQNRRG